MNQQVLKQFIVSVLFFGIIFALYILLLLSCSAAAAAKSLQLCPTLCDPIDGSPPGSAIPGILQARTLEWVAISFSNACHVQFFATPWTAAYQASLSFTISPGACSNSCPSSQWCHPTILSSLIPFCPCLLSFPASGSLPMSQFFTSCGQRIGASASASVLLMNIQDWFPLGLTTGPPGKPWNDFFLTRCEDLSLGSREGAGASLTTYAFPQKLMT